MNEIEETLSRELHEVAGGLHIPVMPALPEEPSRSRRWLPALAAAAVVLIVLGVIAVVGAGREDQAPEPAPPSPTPSETKSTAPPVEVSTGAPKIPYTLDGQLYVDGEQVPGTWWYLQVAGPTWLAMRVEDGTWWWGRGPEPQQIESVYANAGPVLSPDGLYAAALSEENGGTLFVFSTDPAGEALGGAPVDLGDSGISIRAVTSDGKVIVQGDTTAIMWLKNGESSPPVDLTETAPGVYFHAATDVGLWASDGEDGPAYLADLSDDGEITKIVDLPPSQGLVVSPGGEWMAWTPMGTLGGEVTELGSLEASTVDGGQATTFTPPDGWGFKVHAWVWEDDDNLVSTVVKGQAERMVRCSVLTESCVLIDAP